MHLPLILAFKRLLVNTSYNLLHFSLYIHCAVSFIERLLFKKSFYLEKSQCKQLYHFDFIQETHEIVLH